MATGHEFAQLERAAQAIELSGEGILEFPALDPDDPLAGAAPAHYSARLQALLGAPQGELPSVLQTWLVAVHPDDLQSVTDQRRRQVAEPGEPRTLEYRVLVAGETRWWRERSRVWASAEPGRLRLLGLVADISDERRQQIQVQRELDLLRQTQASAGVGGWEVDLARQELYWTEETHAIHEVPPGFKPDLATAINFYAPEHIPIITEAVQRCMRGEPYDVELDIITYTGRRLHIHAAGRPYHEFGQLTRMYGTFRDITESRQREDELRRQLELIARQEGAIQALSTPIIQIWDRIITLPVIGIVDSDRANHIMDRLLTEVTRVRARYAILDLTGVDEIDTGTADYVLQIVRAVKLLGAKSLLCGLQPAVARTLSDLGVDMSALLAHRNLQGALQSCIRALAVGARSPRSS